jgi:hypothetical protein
VLKVQGGDWLTGLGNDTGSVSPFSTSNHYFWYASVGGHHPCSHSVLPIFSNPTIVSRQELPNGNYTGPLDGSFKQAKTILTFLEIFLPISKVEWNIGDVAGPLQSELLEFLSNNRESAYTIEEIIDGMKLKFKEDWTYASIYGSLYISILTSLDALMVQGKVLCRIVGTSAGRRPYFMVT